MTPGLALLPLRVFLGATFAYAGVYKLSDAGFLHRGADTYIGDQLAGFAAGTPGGPLLETFALPQPVLAGVGVAVLEIAIGLLALVGRFTRAAAIGGLVLSLVLFLTASWHTVPYFLGSDIVFAFAWLPFALAGAAGQPALDSRPARELRLRRRGRVLVPETGALLTRRAALLQALGFTAAATGALAGVSVAARGSVPAAPARRAAGTVVADAAALAPGDALSVPINGTPALVIRGADGVLKAFDATCTHAGCEVGWRDGEIRCPCHHARFDPVSGEPTRGPAREPLAVISVVERGGKIVAE
ncbi:MAG TPA: Rieske 2Fe-2S domain-containing protein [Solirubrobacteraceae bacterium]|nr:Rieske 2Fe-2S domain-containing protein [Solirubrobacteraceae bacterium]